jgi:hypothetical protein
MSELQGFVVFVYGLFNNVVSKFRMIEWPMNCIGSVPTVPKRNDFTVYLKSEVSCMVDLHPLLGLGGLHT